MGKLTKAERDAIDAVARRFSATWEEGREANGVHLEVAGRRIALGITTVGRRGGAPRSRAKPRLRFDKVAIRLVERLQARLGDVVPTGTTVLVTVTAPIRLASKTTEALEERIRALLGRRASTRDEQATIHGNRVRIRVSRGAPGGAPPVLGFVHNPDPDGVVLLDMAAELLDLVRARPGGPPARRADTRWLVVRSARPGEYLDAYRYICSQLPLASGYAKIVIVSSDGRVAIVGE
jgi:hypothetical protein